VPLQMTETAAITAVAKPATLLQGYDLALRPRSFFNTSDFGVGAGGVFSTLHDMLLFLQANMAPDASLLGRAMDLSQSLGLGWDSLPGQQPTKKNGLMTDGFATDIEFDRTKKVGSIVLANIENSPTIVSLGWIANGGVDVSNQVALPLDFVSAVTGIYLSEGGHSSFDVEPVNGSYLSVTVTRSGVKSVLRLLSLKGSRTKFWVDDTSEAFDQLEFDIDPLTMKMTLQYLSAAGKDAHGNAAFSSYRLVKTAP
jgi:CubicO group peptidase (beta-lactamase class C family)